MNLNARNFYKSLAKLKDVQMQRIGIAGFQHETNTFSKTPTPLENFLNQSGFYPKLLAGKEMLRFSEGKINIAASGFMADAETFGFTVLTMKLVLLKSAKE